MKYIVLDMEWNMPYDKKKTIRTPVYFPEEIIQIGAVKLDEEFHILDTFKILVRPIHYKTMHRKVEGITKITTEKLQYGFLFPLAFKHFKKWCGEDFAFLTWGPDDISALRGNMMMHRLNTGWIPQSYDVQHIFDEQITKEDRQISLVSAMKILEIPARDAHDALNDARNTASVCQRLDMEKGIAEYQFRHGTSEFYGKPYETKESALADMELLHFECPFCGEAVNCGDFVKQNDEKYIGIGNCESGEELFVRFKFVKCRDNQIRVVRIVYQMDEKNREYYQKKKQKADEKEQKYRQYWAAVCGLC